MKKITKKMGIIILCLCMATAMCISASAASITINSQYGGVSGYSYHIEHTPNGVRGYSEGNFVHNTSDKVFYYAYVSGSTTYKVLYAYLESANGSSIDYADIVQKSTIESNPEITFSRGYDATMTMEESGFTGADSWAATYTYEWDYSSALSKMTIVSGTYTGSGT